VASFFLRFLLEAGEDGEGGVEGDDDTGEISGTNKAALPAGKMRIRLM
jgi:hypothetical protein